MCDVGDLCIYQIIVRDISSYKGVTLRMTRIATSRQVHQAIRALNQDDFPFENRPHSAQVTIQIRYGTLLSRSNAIIHNFFYLPEIYLALFLK